MSFFLGEPPIALCRTIVQPGHQKSIQQRMMVDVCGAAETALKNDKGGDSEDVASRKPSVVGDARWKESGRRVHRTSQRIYMVQSVGGERSVERERMRRLTAAPASLHQTYSRVQFLFFEVLFS